MDYNVIVDNLPLYLEGLWVTIQLVVIALVSGFGLAVPLALILKLSSQSVYLFLSGDTFIGSDVLAILRYGPV